MRKSICLVLFFVSCIHSSHRSIIQESNHEIAKYYLQQSHKELLKSMPDLENSLRKSIETEEWGARVLLVFAERDNALKRYETLLKEYVAYERVLHKKIVDLVTLGIEHKATVSKLRFRYGAYQGISIVKFQKLDQELQVLKSYLGWIAKFCYDIGEKNEI